MFLTIPSVTYAHHNVVFYMCWYQELLMYYNVNIYVSLACTKAQLSTNIFFGMCCKKLWQFKNIACKDRWPTPVASSVPMHRFIIQLNYQHTESESTSCHKRTRTDFNTVITWSKARKYVFKLMYIWPYLISWFYLLGCLRQWGSVKWGIIVIMILTI